MSKYRHKEGSRGGFLYERLHEAELVSDFPFQCQDLIVYKNLDTEKVYVTDIFRWYQMFEPVELRDTW